MENVDSQISKSFEELEKSEYFVTEMNKTAFSVAVDIAAKLVGMDVLSEEQIIEATQVPEKLVHFLMEYKEYL